MTHREKFQRVMHYDLSQGFPFYATGPWAETVRRWRGEGLPEGVGVSEFLGLKPMKLQDVSCNGGPMREPRVLSEDAEWILRTDQYGRTLRSSKLNPSIEECIDFPVKTPEDLRLVLDTCYDLDRMEDRFPADWEAKSRAKAADTSGIVIAGGCYYWVLRSLAGVETASYLFYDAPELVAELFERCTTIAMEGVRRASTFLKLDAIGFGEDIAFKNGPFVSPDMFRRYLLPGYRRIMDLGHSLGIDLTWYDSDGDLRLYIQEFLEVGVNNLVPCEVAAGMAPSELRRRFGRDLRMVGGIDKREIAKGRRAIDAEIERNLPVIYDGGYLPAIDHSVPTDVSFADYCYFIDKLRTVLESAG